MTAFMERIYFCTVCYKAYNHPGQHKCENKCPRCTAFQKCPLISYKKCDDCNRLFVSDLCLQNHHTSGLCRYLQCCHNCGKTYHTYKNHRCGYEECKQCRKLQPLEHECYIQPMPRKDPTKAQRYIFYDFECMLDDSQKHVPNLCVVHSVCQKCMEDPMNCSVCTCERKQLIFSGEKTLDDFGQWLFSGKNQGAICIAHNAQAYDLYLIMEYVHENGIKPTLIQNGKKILSMEAFGLKFIETLNFFPMSLAKLPQAFGLEELKKGYFPHLFNTTDNQQYKGPIPDIKFYDPDGMKSDKRAEFMSWYIMQTEFNFQEELKNYCISDVDILQRCCGKFRNLFMTYTDGIEPFLKSITIASACNQVYRTMFLQEKQVAIIPTHGYYTGRQSVIAFCWMNYLSQQNSLQITHARNGGEVKVEGWMIDGVDEHKTLYEFHGCFWHGCSKCFPNRTTINPVNHRTMEELWQHTLMKTMNLRQKGYIVVEQWECDFKAEMKNNEDLAEFYSNSYAPQEPLQPRDAFLGGRTNAIRLFYESKPDEDIRYVDFTSLYPYVCKYAKFPVGHPEIYQADKIPLHVEGLLKCKILPPQNLFLPVRARNKLLFPLCKTCALENSNGICLHDDPYERAFIGTWVTAEIDKAISLGYIILEKYEAWHFPITEQYDPLTKTGGIWAPCIDLWLKHKQQADGWPDWCETDEDKQQYIRNYLDKEGIQLEEQQIIRNEGLRSLAKLMLNSHWGKFGQNPNKSKVTYVSDCSQYVDMMTNDALEVTDLIFVNDEHIALRWNDKQEFVESLPNTNVVLAAYTTAHARLKLYSLLEKLQERVLYFDTDSVIYIHQPEMWNPPVGDYLGELKDETKGIPLTTFVSGGAKNYAYKLADGSTVCKIRGFTLNHRNSLTLNMETLQDLVISSDRSQSLISNPYKIIRKDGSLYTKEESKAYQIVYDKRFIDKNFQTYPFGWKPIN